jgi:hypothetical protein
MPSPFPGMDPYLENPDWFPCLHDSVIVGIMGSLQVRLPEFYYAQSRQRVWLEASHRRVEPDVDVLHSGRQPSGWGRGNGGVAVADEVEVAEPVVISVRTIEHDPFEEPFIEIRRRRGSADRLVASIEVVSPANKTTGNQGREKYLAKQQEILGAQVHLIEIDLLRGGDHATAVPRELALEKAGPFDYHVCVYRFDRPTNFFVYPIQLEQRLPGIAIPLLPGDADIPLALQSVFDRAYDEGPYRRTIDYGHDPIIPTLRPEQLEWIKGRLQTHA